MKYTSINEIEEVFKAKKENFKIGFISENKKKGSSNPSKGYTKDPRYKRILSDQKRQITRFRNLKKDGLIRNTSIAGIERLAIKQRKEIKNRYRKENGSLKGINSNKEYLRTFENQERETKKLRRKREINSRVESIISVDPEPVENEINTQESNIIIHESRRFYFEVLPNSPISVFQIYELGGDSPTARIQSPFDSDRDYFSEYSFLLGLGKLYNDCKQYQDSFNGDSDRIALIDIVSFDGEATQEETLIIVNAYLPNNDKNG